MAGTPLLPRQTWPRPGRGCLLLLCVAWLWVGPALGQDPSEDLTRGLAAHKAGRHQEAAELLGRHLESRPRDTAARIARAASLRALERYP